MKNLSRAAALFALLAFSAVVVTPGCATVAVALPVVLAAVQGAELAVNMIEAFVNAYYKAHPNSAAEKKCDDGIARTRIALGIVVNLTTGVSAVDQGQLQSAFSDFEATYNELIALTKPIGVSVGAGFRTSPGGESLTVPPASSFRPVRR